MDKEQRKYDQNGLRSVGLAIALILVATLIAIVLVEAR